MSNAFSIRSVTPDDKTSWLRMREALWPDESGSHASEIDRYLAGQLTMPLEVLIAVDDGGSAIGFAELSIRAYAEDCETDRVAYLEGWCSIQRGGARASAARWSLRRSNGRGRRDAPSSARTPCSTMTSAPRRTWRSVSKRRSSSAVSKRRCNDERSL